MAVGLVGGPTASEPRIDYSPRPDANPEEEARALAAVYAFVLERHHQKRLGAQVGDGKNGTETVRSNATSHEQPAGKGG